LVVPLRRTRSFGIRWAWRKVVRLREEEEERAVRKEDWGGRKRVNSFNGEERGGGR